MLTLAHELGHAVHQTLAAPKGTLLADTPLTLAETASIFGEGLVFERLLADATGAERRDLLAGRIEDALNTVVRQIAFHRFETRFHAASGRAAKLSPETDRPDLAGGDGREPGPGGPAQRAATSTTGPTSATSCTRRSMSTPTPSGTCWSRR